MTTRTSSASMGTSTAARSSSDDDSTRLARDRVEHFLGRIGQIRKSLHEVVIGQDRAIDQLLICALTESHALLVGVPGLAKTLMVKALASVFQWKFNRIQFTPDLMPGYHRLRAVDPRRCQRRDTHDVSAGAGVREPGAGG